MGSDRFWTAHPEQNQVESFEQTITRLELEPHPEGGWYREVHRSEIPVQRPDGSLRAGLTVILFLLGNGETSRWHRVSGADEVWSYAGGDSLELSCLPPQGGPTSRIVRIRPPARGRGAGWPLAGSPLSWRVVPGELLRWAGL